MPLLSVGDEDSDEEFMTFLKKVWESEVYLIQTVKKFKEKDLCKIKSYFNHQDNKNLWLSSDYIFEELFDLENQHNFTFKIDEYLLNCSSFIFEQDIDSFIYFE